MKKIFLLLAMIITLSWCWTQQTVQEEMEVLHSSDGVFLSYEWVTLIPIGWFEMEELKSNNQFQEDAVAWPYSKYYVVWFWFKNDTKESVIFWPSDMPPIYDSEWRKFNPDIELTSDFYVPDAVSFFEIKPWIPAQWMVVYEVPKDATWFNIQLWYKKVILDEDIE